MTASVNGWTVTGREHDTKKRAVSPVEAILFTVESGRLQLATPLLPVTLVDDHRAPEANQVLASVERLDPLFQQIP